MMVNIAQVKSGASKYIDTEVLGQISDWRKWVVGAFALPYLDKLDALMNDQAIRDALTQIGTMPSGGDLIDVDKLRDMFLTQARERGRVSINIPMVGPYYIGEPDIIKMYEYIVTS